MSQSGHHSHSHSHSDKDKHKHKDKDDHKHKSDKDKHKHKDDQKHKHKDDHKHKSHKDKDKHKSHKHGSDKSDKKDMDKLRNTAPVPEPDRFVARPFQAQVPGSSSPMAPAQNLSAPQSYMGSGKDHSSNPKYSDSLPRDVEDEWSTFEKQAKDLEACLKNPTPETIDRAQVLESCLELQFGVMDPLTRDAARAKLDELAVKLRAAKAKLPANEAGMSTMGSRAGGDKDGSYSDSDYYSDSSSDSEDEQPADEGPPPEALASSAGGRPERADFEVCERIYQSQKGRSKVVLDIAQFTPVRPLGEGAFGAIMLMKDNKTGEEIAMKSLPQMKGRDSFVGFEKEINALQRMHHRCVLMMFGHCFTDQSLNIGMALMSGGSLADAIRDQPDWFRPTDKAVIAVGIALGMKHIHEKGIIHRDLKPANILLDEFHLPRVADFGCCRFVDAGVTQTAGVGTPLYMAPEQGDRNYTNKVDVFAFGGVLYEIVTGKRMFHDCRSVNDITMRIARGKMPHISKSVPRFVRHMIEHCWSLHASHRPSFRRILSQLKKHKFKIMSGVNSKYVEKYYQWANGKKSG